MDIRGIANLATKLAEFPRLGLAQLPTPLEPLRRLSAFLEGPCLWVKRDDATGLGFGGNKLRKLDYVLHEAMAARADTLVSGGFALAGLPRFSADAEMIRRRHQAASQRAEVGMWHSRWSERR